jgi:hypothetical protein
MSFFGRHVFLRSCGFGKSSGLFSGLLFGDLGGSSLSLGLLDLIRKSEPGPPC